MSLTLRDIKQKLNDFITPFPPSPSGINFMKIRSTFIKSMHKSHWINRATLRVNLQEFRHTPELKCRNTAVGKQRDKNGKKLKIKAKQ
jgi:hypothetical protein